MSFVVLDTGVIAESVNVDGEFNKQATIIFEAINSKSLTGLVSPLTISEVHYVLWRVYDKLAVKNPEKVSEDFCEYIYYHPNIVILQMSLDLLIESGRIKHRYGLALSDCFVLAASKMNRCKAVFRHKEDEMNKVIKDLNREFDLAFLEDY
ncbi:MAG: type II toxin-antitoxin system VapC family toxin [Nitrososphaerales archaeon]